MDVMTAQSSITYQHNINDSEGNMEKYYKMCLSLFVAPFLHLQACAAVSGSEQLWRYFWRLEDLPPPHKLGIPP